MIELNAFSSMLLASIGRVLMLSVLALPLPLSAETATSSSDVKPGTRLETYLYSKARMTDLYAIGVYWDQRLDLEQDCHAPIQVKPKRLGIVQPVELPEGRDAPVQGVWTMGFDFIRCGDTKRYNAIFFAYKDAKTVVDPYYPGTTDTTVPLLHDALAAAFPVARAQLLEQQGVRNCRDLELTDMRVSEEPQTPSADDRILSAWIETWTFTGCDKSVSFDILFKPSPAGGTDFVLKL
jgi:hypothetical protein